MATLSAKKLQDALNRAKNIGQVEEQATIVGCELVFQSLLPEDYESIAQETEEKVDIAFLNAYRMEHLCRSIVELNGVSLRGFKMVEIEVEEENPQTRQMETKTISLERHAFIRDHVLNTWSREALDIAFKKFNDVIHKAERTAQDGVSFLVPDETGDEKYRRLLLELKEVEGSIPADLAARLLEENGYAKAMTAQEFQKVDERLSRVMAGQEALPEGGQEEPPAPEVALPTPPVRRPPPTDIRPEMIPSSAVRTPAPISNARDEDVMRTRQPMNRGEVPSHVPTPQHQGESSPTPVRQRSAPPPNATALRSRYSEIAALEGMGVEDDLSAQPAPVVPKVDPQKAAAVLDAPPRGGINPRYRPPVR